MIPNQVPANSTLRQYVIPAGDMPLKVTLPLPTIVVGATYDPASSTWYVLVLEES